MDNHKTSFEQTDNTIIKIKRTKKETMGKKKHYTENSRLSNKNP
jgi:hypothetical protein